MIVYVLSVAVIVWPLSQSLISSLLQSLIFVEDADEAQVAVLVKFCVVPLLYGSHRGEIAACTPLRPMSRRESRQSMSIPSRDRQRGGTLDRSGGS